MNVVIAAGGTGGHIIPGIAVAEVLADEPNTNVLFLGTGKALENDIITAHGFSVEHLPSQAVYGKGLRGVWSLLRILPGALRKAREIYQAFSADVVVGFGGYPSFVPLLAARLSGIPRVLHEQNVKVGLANKVLSVLANKVFCVKGASGFFCSSRVTEVGNPVRKSFYGCSPYKSPVPGEPLRLFVFGGSQGAKAINQALLELVPWLKEQNIELVHQTGERDFERVSQQYRDAGYEPTRVCAFVQNMQEEYERAHLIVCRAGAMSVAEISACGRPAIYIPLELAASHQKDNVEALAREGGAVVLLQGEDLSDRLRETIEQLIEPDRLAAVAKAAASYHLKGSERPASLIAREVAQLASENARGIE